MGRKKPAIGCGPGLPKFPYNPVFLVSQISPQRPRDRHPADWNRTSWLQIQIWLIPSLLSPLPPAGSGAPADMGQSLDQGAGVSSGCRVTSSSWFAWDYPDFSMPWAIWDSWLPYTGTSPSWSLPPLEHCWGWGVEWRGKGSQVRQVF